MIVAGYTGDSDSGRTVIARGYALCRDLFLQVIPLQQGAVNSVLKSPVLKSPF